MRNFPKLQSRRPATAPPGADKSHGTASPSSAATANPSLHARDFPARPATANPATSRPLSAACSSPRFTLPMAIRSPARNSHTSLPGWNASCVMRRRFTRKKSRSYSPATTTSCRPTATSTRRGPTRITRCSSRKAARCFNAILEQGWVDAVRVRHPDAPIYTFWDYMRNRWPRDAGLRIDHLLLSAQAAERLVDAGVDRAVRGKEGASDHAPVWVMLRDEANPLRPVRAPALHVRRARPGAKPQAAKSGPRPLLVIDGDSFAHRMYHALPKNILRRCDKPAGAILGFANNLLRVYREATPGGVIVCWDTLDAPT